MTDVVAQSVAAYSDHLEEYAKANANLMSEERQRFADAMWWRSAKILDAGCGPGRDLAWFTAAGFDAVGVDLNANFVAEAEKVGRAVVADLRRLPFPHNTFEGIWACASLVHLTPLGAEQALLEFRRVADVGARLYVSVKCDGETGWRDTAHGRRWFTSWDLTEFASLVESVGFVVADAEFNGAFIDVRAVVA